MAERIGRVEGRGKYFLLIPGPSGQKQRVPIDIDRLRIQDFFEVWTWSSQQSGLVRAHGIETGITSGIDPQPVLELFDEMMELLVASLSDKHASDTLSRVREATVDQLAPLRNIIEAVAHGSLGTAAHGLKDMMYDYMTSVGALAEHVSRLEQEVSGMHVATEQMAHTLELPDQVEDVYATWQLVCLEFLDVIDGLGRLEQSIEQRRSHVRARADVFRSVEQLWQNTFAQAMMFLDDPTLNRTDTFLLRAIEYVHSDHVDRDAVRHDVEQAKEYVSQCERLVADSVAQWKTERDVLLVESADFVKHIDQLVDRLSELSHNHHQYRDRLLVGAVFPYACPDASLTQAQYQRVESCVGDAKWMPERARKRLKMFAQCLPDDLGSCPSMPDDVASSLMQVSEQIVEVEQRVLRVSSSVGTAQSHVSTAADDGFSASGSADSAISVDPDIVRYLYELVIIVADEVTCKPRYFSLSNVRALLEVVVRLTDRLTADEVMSYASAIRSLVRADDVCVVVERSQLSSAWRYSKKTWLWVSDPLKSLAMLKLSQHASANAAQLREKHGVTVDRVRAAKQQRDSEKRDKHSDRQSHGESEE